MRPWGKKRGGRSLGSRWSGTAGEFVFFSLLFLVGTFGLTLVLINEFAPDRVAKIQNDALPSTLEGAFSVSLGTVSLGALIIGILSVAAMATGGGSLVFRLLRLSSSNEYRSELANRAVAIEKGAIELIGPGNTPVSRSSDKVLPNVPQGRSVTDSPGERLAFRLPGESKASGIIGFASLALLWNSVWFILLAVSVSGFWNETPRWILTFLLFPFGVLGYIAFKQFLTQFRQIAGIGPTIVEIDHHPLVPGEPCELYVSQRGKATLKRLKVRLLCEEESFYRQGTDVRVDKHESFVHVLSKRRDVSVDPQSPWEQQLHLDLPPDVMHSFVGTHNAIRWKIVVEGESRPWPSFCRSFPVVVHPQVARPKRSPR